MLNDGQEYVRVEDVYGRVWVYVYTVIGDLGPHADVISGWVKRYDLKCTGTNAAIGLRTIG